MSYSVLALVVVVFLVGYFTRIIQEKSEDKNG